MTQRICQLADENGFSRKSGDQRIGFGHNEAAGAGVSREQANITRIDRQQLPKAQLYCLLRWLRNATQVELSLSSGGASLERTLSHRSRRISYFKSILSYCVLLFPATEKKIDLNITRTRGSSANHFIHRPFPFLPD